jgi:hypothetical protein
MRERWPSSQAVQQAIDEGHWSRVIDTDDLIAIAAICSTSVTSAANAIQRHGRIRAADGGDSAVFGLSVLAIRQGGTAGANDLKPVSKT